MKRILLILPLLAAVPAYAQNPPTPTPLPPGTPYVFLPDSYSLWASAPHAIQLWNQAGDIRTVFQILILLAILSALIYTLIGFRRAFTRRDEER